MSALGRDLKRYFSRITPITCVWWQQRLNETRGHFIYQKQEVEVLTSKSDTVESISIAGLAALLSTATGFFKG